MDFDDKLNQILRYVFSESELDYPNEWERFRQERERLRQLAAREQAQAAEREQAKELQAKMAQAGGFTNWFQGREWSPGNDFELVWDVETGDGILLPSVRKRDKNLRLFIPWVLVEFMPQHAVAGTVTEAEPTRTYPFAQFDIDDWPSKGDFDWDVDDLYRSGTLGRNVSVSPRAAMALFNSDKNHYHMLRGDDKDLVDEIIEKRIMEWFSEHEFDTERQEDY